MNEVEGKPNRGGKSDGSIGFDIVTVGTLEMPSSPIVPAISIAN